jgi:arginine-tRNA-protein transferase
VKFVVRSSCSCASTRMSRTAADDVGAASSSSSSCMTTSENNSSSKKGEEAAAVSVVTDLGVYSSTCGYCKSASRTSVTQGLWAHTLSVYDYQALLDRGWRRSGMTVYKPDMRRTCCPTYTIRLEADSFSPSKDQARVLHRMQSLLQVS